VNPEIQLVLKAPTPGAVKTRLGREIGMERACRIYRWLVERQCAALPPAWPATVHYAPDDAEATMRGWLGDGFAYRPQAAGDLGARLSAATADAFERGAAAAILIGADCPTLGVADFERARELLGSPRDAVFGPAGDGGYYLLGLRRNEPSLFADVAWSTGGVLAQSRANAERAGLTPRLLDEKEDIDDAASLRRAVEAGHLPPAPGAPEV